VAGRCGRGSPAAGLAHITSWLPPWPSRAAALLHCTAMPARCVPLPPALLCAMLLRSSQFCIATLWLPPPAVMPACTRPHCPSSVSCGDTTTASHLTSHLRAAPLLSCLALPATATITPACTLMLPWSSWIVAPARGSSTSSPRPARAWTGRAVPFSLSSLPPGLIELRQA
jgi:hypothetical protein